MTNDCYANLAITRAYMDWFGVDNVKDLDAILNRLYANVDAA